MKAGKCRVLFAIGILISMFDFARGDLVENVLPFTLTPLVQQGSANLLPGDFKGWDLHGAAQAVVVDGQACLRLGAKQNGEAAGFHQHLSAKPGALYEVSFRYRLGDDVQWDYADDNAGIEGWLVATSGGKECASTRLFSLRKSKGWRMYNAFLYMPATTDGIDWNLSFKASAGTMLLCDAVLREAAVGAEQGRQLLRFNGAGYAELPRHDEPAAPDKLTVFVRPDPDAMFFYSHPHPEEIGQSIEIAAAPGEARVAAIGVYTPVSAALHVRATAIVGVNGNDMGAVASVDLAQFNARRDDYYGRGATWRWVTDSLIPCPDEVSAPAGRTQVFWLRIAVPKSAKAGRYGGRLIIKIDGQADRELAVDVEVYPFELSAARGTTFGLYADTDRWSKMNDKQVAGELADFKAHGIDSLELPGRGQPRWRDRQIAGWDWDAQTLRAMPLIQQAGLRGPYRIWLEWLPELIARKLGVKIEDQSPARWPDAIAVAYRDSLRAIEADVLAKQWGKCVFEGIDEPGYWKKGSPEIFAWQYGNAAQAGMATYCTSSYLPDDPLGKFLDEHCYTGRCFDGAARSALIVGATRQAHQSPWIYATGSYSGQVGKIANNRYGSGFIFFRSQCDGLVSWTFQRPRGDALNDFAGPKAQPMITLPDSRNAGADLDTPQWEGLRQGWLDYRYMATATAAVARAKGRGDSTAERDLDAIVDEMPWDGSAFEDCPISDQACDEWRERLARLIVRIGN